VQKITANKAGGFDVKITDANGEEATLVRRQYAHPDLIASLRLILPFVQGSMSELVGSEDLASHVQVRGLTFSPYGKDEFNVYPKITVPEKMGYKLEVMGTPDHPVKIELPCKLQLEKVPVKGGEILDGWLMHLAQGMRTHVLFSDLIHLANAAESSHNCNTQELRKYVFNTIGVELHAYLFEGKYAQGQFPGFEGNDYVFPYDLDEPDPVLVVEPDQQTDE
jgi:hypothetical protein